MSQKDVDIWSCRPVYLFIIIVVPSSICHAFPMVWSDCWHINVQSPCAQLINTAQVLWHQWHGKDECAFTHNHSQSNSKPNCYFENDSKDVEWCCIVLCIMEKNLKNSNKHLILKADSWTLTLPRQPLFRTKLYRSRWRVINVSSLSLDG